MEKKYYWLRLKDDFFNLTTTKLLRKMPEGDKLTIIYLKLQLLSLKSNGTLTHHKLLPNLADELAVAIDEDNQYVNLTLNTLEKLKLIEPLSNDDYLLTAMNDLIGIETKSALQKREYRKKIGQIKDNKQTLLGHESDINRTMSDREEKRRDKKEIDKNKIKIIEDSKIIDYFNLKANTKRYVSGSDRLLIIDYVDKMLKKGDTLQDIKDLIDYKLANPNTKKKELTSWINTEYAAKNLADAKTWVAKGRPTIEQYFANQHKTKAQSSMEILHNCNSQFGDNETNGTISEGF